MPTPFDKVFLASSDRALRSFAESHDFFWGSGIALHNLRWQVIGFAQAYPNATQEDIAQRFANVSGLPGSNAFNLVLRRQWTEVENLLTQLRLSNLISIYESWIAAAESELGLPERTLERPTQFPEDVARLSEILGGQSRPMAEVSTYCATHRANRSGRESDLLRCYRAFKEIRNAFAHAGSRANQRTLERVADYLAVRSEWSTATAKSKQAPAIPAIAQHSPDLPDICVGEPVVVTNRAVVGFSAVLRTLIVTLDARIAGTAAANLSAKYRWKATYGPHSQLPADPRRAKATFRARWRHSGMPQLLDGDELLADFRADHIVV